MDRQPYQPYYSYPFTDSLYVAQPSRPIGYPATFGYPYASSDLGRSYYTPTVIRPMLTPSRIVTTTAPTNDSDLFSTDFLDQIDDPRRLVSNRYVRNIRPVTLVDRPRAPILGPPLTLAPMSERIRDLDDEEIKVVTPKPVKTPKEPEGILRDPRTVTSELCTIS